MSGRNSPRQVFKNSPSQPPSELPGRSSDADHHSVHSVATSAESREDGASRATLEGEDRAGVTTGKVAIPRASFLRVSPGGRRVSKACESCREQKVKCTGGQPACQRCQLSGVVCIYDDSKKEKRDKEMKALTSQVQIYEALLREVCLRTEPEIAEYVNKVLLQQGSSTDDTGGETVKQEISLIAPVPAPVPFLGGLDYTNEDFNRDMKIQAMGFVGGHSVLAWLYRLKRMLEHSSAIFTDELDYDSVASVNFFVDDTMIPIMDDVDVSQRPPISVANKFVDHYFQAVHPSFPIIGKMLFLDQFRSFYSPSSVRPGKRWLAILNLVFAIAVKHTRQEQSDEGLAYFSRAWKLSMGDISLLDHPNLQQVQVEGLIAFYLMSVGQINRSWRICGIALGTAVTMGLNLRSESDAIAPVSKETRYRIWWSLYMLDTSLCVMTGRPPTSNDAFCTTPRPVPFKEEEFNDPDITQIMSTYEARHQLGHMSFDLQGLEKSPHRLLDSFSPNISLYFLLLIDLALLTRECVDKLYAPEAAQRPWHDTERIIATLNSKTDAWLARLPPEFHFQAGSLDFERERLNLAFRFYKTKILMAQPCLNRVTSSQSSGWSSPAGNFCHSTAASCVDLAMQMLELFPSPPDTAWIYLVSPWWCVLHYLMQATGVLLIELCLRAQLGTTQYSRVVSHVGQATSWLAHMAARDPSAQRAWLLCRDLLSNHPGGLEVEVFAGRESSFLS